MSEPLEAEVVTERAIVPGQHGGWRPGAGRKRVRPLSPRELYGEQIDGALELLAQEVRAVAQAASDLAKGEYIVLARDRHGNWKRPPDVHSAQAAVELELHRVYQRSPSVEAIRVVFDRVLGKVGGHMDERVKNAALDGYTLIEGLIDVIEDVCTPEQRAAIHERVGAIADEIRQNRAILGG